MRPPASGRLRTLGAVNPLDFGSRGFRARLERELPRWREEGIIDEEAAAVLADRYRLDEEGTSLASAAIYTLGSLLVGGGLISLAAWNWAKALSGQPWSWNKSPNPM